MKTRLHLPNILAKLSLILLVAVVSLVILSQRRATAAHGAVPQALPYLVKNVEVFHILWTPGPDATVVMNDILYFGGNNGTHGFELWRSDGTEPGTYMVKDIYPGSESSTPIELVVLNNVLYFSADDGTHGKELWRSDGTEPGTYMVKDIHPSQQSDLYGMVVFNGQLLFTAEDGTHGYELWRSNGTGAGTQLVKDINAADVSSHPFPVAKLSGALLMQAQTSSAEIELWRTDGTETGTYRIQEFEPSLDAVVMNNIAYFSADDGSGPGLWRSDGTETGTTLVSPASQTYGPYEFAILGNTLFFTAYADDTGTELWKSNGTLVGTSLVKDIQTGTGSSYPASLTAMGSQLFFSADDGANGHELWQSDGTEGGTDIVANLSAGSSGSNPYNLVAAHNRLYFVATGDGAGVELWQSDGTNPGTMRLTDINPGIFHSHPRSLRAMGDRLFFGAESDVNPGLWAVADPQDGPAFVVNTRSDADQGVCTLGHCSLREAILAANAQAGQNTLTFAETAQGTITPNTALPTITEDLVINGPGLGYLVLNGALVNTQPLMQVNGGPLMLSGLTFWQGGGNSTPVGGALLAISPVTLNSVRFNENRAGTGGAITLYDGGDLYNVEFYGNTALSNGGAIAAFNGTVTLYNTQFNSNTATGDGGAIYMQGSFLNVFTSDLSGNGATHGGAIYSDARPTIDRTVFSGNHATGDGGAVYATSIGPATLTNLLMTENTADGNGNVLYLTGNAPSLLHTLIHTTIAAPEQQPGTAVYMNATGTLSVTNSIIANHLTGLVRANGTLTEDYNLFHDNETDRTGFSAGANSLNDDPNFISAADGLYQLTPGSPAVDAGTLTAITWDFTDRPRPQGSAPDIGFDELAQTLVTGPGYYAIADTGVAITVTQTGDLASVQLVWIPLDHPGYDEENEGGDPTGQGGYWTIVGLNSQGNPASGFTLTLILPHDNEPNPAVCRWEDPAWDCGRNGFTATTVWRHNVTAYSDWAVGVQEAQTGFQLHLPLAIRP